MAEGLPTEAGGAARSRCNDEREARITTDRSPGTPPCEERGNRHRCANEPPPGHLGGMSVVVEYDVAVDPVDVALLGLVGIMLQPHGFCNLIEQFPGPSFHHVLLRSSCP